MLIVGLTANAPKHIAEMIDAGMDSVWPKPLPGDEELYMRLKRLHLFERSAAALSAAGDATVTSKGASANATVGKEEEDDDDWQIGGLRV